MSRCSERHPISGEQCVLDVDAEILRGHTEHQTTHGLVWNS